MQKIDAHQHFWKYNPWRDTWITSEMAAIQKNFLPTDLEPLLEENGIDGCIAVQADQSEEETDFLLSLAEKHSFIKGVVGWIDLTHSEAEERLSYYAGFKKLKSFRHILQGEQQRDFMLREDFLNGVSHLHKHNFAYDILIHEDQLPFIPSLVEQFPEQRFVLDHIAKPPIKKGALTEWRKGIEALSRHQNLCCKVSGLVTEADWHHWKGEDFIPYLDTVVQVFGTERLLFGSDWPVCLIAASYGEVVGIVKDYFSGFTAWEQEQLFGGNAALFYDLDEEEIS